ncbi:MAG: DUF4191 family protein [Microbacterium sp.]
MARSTTTEKQPGTFAQMKSLYTFTSKEYKWLPFALGGIILVCAGVGVLVGVLQGSVLSIVVWTITGVLLGVLAGMFLMSRLATKAMYKQLDGMQGASGHVVSNMLGRSWRGEEMPVGVNPKSKDAVYRAVGRGGVVLVGEGSPGRLKRLMRDEELKAKRVASGVPVTTFYVGHDEGEVPIDQLAKQIKKLPKKVDKATMGAVIQRIESVSQSVASLPIPKGIDPMRARAPRPR